MALERIKMIRKVSRFTHTFTTTSPENVDVTSAGLLDMSKTTINVTREGGSSNSYAHLTSLTNVEVRGSNTDVIAFELVEHY